MKIKSISRQNKTFSYQLLGSAFGKIKYSFIKQRRKMSKCFSGVNLFPLLQKKRTSMKNNTKLKSREIVFVLLHNNLEFSVC